MNKLSEIVKFLDEITMRESIKDWNEAHNGLQCENKTGKVTKIASSVDCGLEDLLRAKKAGVDLLIVHHGIFWSPPIPFTGVNFEKVKLLLDNNIALYSSHLPLDANNDFGNNVLIAKNLKLEIVDRCFDYYGTKIGVLTNGIKGGVKELEKSLEKLFPMGIKKMQFGIKNPKKIAICSGGAGSVVAELPSLGVDTLIVGELKEHHYVMAQELKLNLYQCGHYATETFGVRALAEICAKEFNLKNVVIKSENPL